MEKVYRYIYGPMPARRQGKAIGIDLFRKKICTFDCVYCEVGNTEVFTSKIDEYAKPEIIFEEIEDFFARHKDITFITFAGCGEPTLHKDLKEIISGIKQRVNVPVSVLTNSSLIDRPQVQDALLQTDLILPSLDSARQCTFEKINRPMTEFKVDNIISGLSDFRCKYAGKIWLEIFLINGLNDSEEDIAALNKAIKKICPDKVQLNTVQRPGTESWAKPLSRECLENIAKMIDANVEVIASGSMNLT